MEYITFLVGIILAVVFIVICIRRQLLTKKDKYYYFVFVVIASAFVLEIFTFNFMAFERTDDSLKRVYNVNINQKDDGVIYNTKDDNVTTQCSVSSNSRTYTITLSGIDMVVKNIDIIPITDDRLVKCAIRYSDDANASLVNTDSNEEIIVSAIKSTTHVKPNFAGETHELELSLTTEEDKMINCVIVRLNEKAQFRFDWLRFMIVAFAIGLALTIYMTRGQKKVVFNPESNIQKAVISGFVILEIMIITGLSLATNAMYDNYGKFEKFNFEAEKDVYNELTLALSYGKVDLNNLDPNTAESEAKGIEELEALDNPYEWGQRTGIIYKWDRAFYDGKYYCYFGIVPVLVFYLPFYLITGTFLSTKKLVLMLAIFTAILMSLLVFEIAKRWKNKLNLWVVIGTMACFINSSMLLYCIGGSKFYEVASVSALVCSLAGILMLYTAFHQGKANYIKIFIGALFMALSVGCRPNFLLASFIVAPLVLNGLAWDENKNHVKLGWKNKTVNYIKRIFRKVNIKAIILFIIPYVIVGVGLMYYNYIRFGSVTEFGAKYQLTVYDTGFYKVTDIGKLPIVLGRGIFMLPSFTSVFPYVKAVSERSNYVGYFYDMAYLGIMASPIMWLLFMFGWSWKRGIKNQRERAFVLTSLIVAVVMCYITTTMGGTSLRYSVDFSWLFYIPVIYIIFDMYCRGKNRGIQKYILILLGLLFVSTVAIHSMVCISPTWSNLSTNVPEIFYRLEEMIVFWR